MSRKTTIYDIAKYLKVSPATVSYVLNDVHKVGDKTKQKVLEAVKLLGYSRDYNAVSLSTGKSKFICVFLPSEGIKISSLQNPFYSEFLGYFQSELRNQDYDVIIKPLMDPKAFESWISSRAIGALVFIGRVHEETYNLIEKLCIPAVFVDIYDDFVKSPNNILIDDKKGSYLATNFLIQNNHKNIAFVSDDRSISVVDEMRYEGYKSALEDNKICVKESNIYVCDASYDGGYDLASKFLDRKDLTGVVCAADSIALGLIKGLEEQGIKIPEDLSIIGFDDVQASRLVSPALTTIRQDIGKKGKLAAQKLLAILENKTLSGKIEIIEPVLIIRHSVKRL